jgi:hypothetical protein
MIEEHGLMDAVGHMFIDAMWGARVVVVMPFEGIRQLIDRIMEWNARDGFEEVSKTTFGNGRAEITFDTGRIVILAQDKPGVGRGVSAQRLYMPHNTPEDIRLAAILMTHANENVMITTF